MRACSDKPMTQLHSCTHNQLMTLPWRRFTAWLGNNSSSTKQRRLLGELHTRMAASGALETDRTALRTSYLPLLRHALVQPLVREEKEGIEPVIQLMQVRLCLYVGEGAICQCLWGVLRGLQARRARGIQYASCCHC